MDFQTLISGASVRGEFLDFETEGGVGPTKVDFEDCEFRNFDNAKWSPVGCTFLGCTFRACNFSLGSWVDCTIRDCSFVSSKLTGTDFTRANWTAFSGASPLRFQDCELSYANFTRVRLGSAVFSRCRLPETEFGGADLAGAQFIDCNLDGTNFQRANLPKADFRTSYNFVIDPVISNVRGAMFSSATLRGLLDSFGIEIE